MTEDNFVQVIITPQVPFKGKYHHAGLFKMKKDVHPYDVYMALVEALDGFVDFEGFE